MDNVTDALYMAASVLLLIIALTVSISSFTTLRSQINDIIQSNDQISMATADGELINQITSSNNSDIRTVGLETVMSSIRRVKKESYIIYISGEIAQKVIFNNIATTLDNGQTYNNETIISPSERVLKISIEGSNYKNIDDKLMKNLYNEIGEKKFKEYIGVYQKQTDEGVSSVNKETYRIITFVEI